MKTTLSRREYPGRVILLGRTADGGSDVIAYGLTGRSSSSRARILVEADEGSFSTQVTDEGLLAQGNPSLLLYTCITRHQDLHLVSNGAQTELLLESARRLWSEGRQPGPLEVLTQAVARPHWVPGSRPGSYIDLSTFEPDAPSYTPRISGALGQGRAALSWVSHVANEAGEPEACRSFFSLPLSPGKASMLSTYAGQNVPSGEAIPSFRGEPLEVSLEADTPRAVAQELYDALGPKAPGEGILMPHEDLRVAVVVSFICRKTHAVESHIINRHP